MAIDADRQTSAERGFTLVELLVAVVLVSVLAAVVLPVVNRFGGSGTEEARRTGFHDVETAVILLMTDSQILSIPNPITGNTPPCAVGTKVLAAFPDADSDNGQGAGNDGGKGSSTSKEAPTCSRAPQVVETSRGTCSMTTTRSAEMARRR